MKLSKRHLAALSISSVFLVGGIAAAATGSLPGQNQTSESPTSIEKSSDTPSASSTDQPSTETGTSTTSQSSENPSNPSDGSTGSATPAAKPKPAPVYGNCQEYGTNRLYTCEVPQDAQSAAVAAPTPEPDPTPVLTDEERQDLTVTNPGH